jgi:23S rRNA pseudouridine1911/1915/1917 synthase
VRKKALELKPDPTSTLLPENHRLTPLFIDNHLLVIVKPAGTLSQADRTGDRDLLTSWREYVGDRYNKPGNVYLGLVHRLDRPVSGVMVFARTSKAAARLSDQFRNQTVEKKYLAIVEGQPEASGILEDYLVKKEGRVHAVAGSVKEAKAARLSYTTLETSSGRTLIEVRLESGRSHQIRVQFASRGYPLLGDLKYGARSEFDGKNLALHAYSLSLDHPTLRTRMTFRASVSEDWPLPFRRVADTLVARDGSPDEEVVRSG